MSLLKVQTFHLFCSLILVHNSRAASSADLRVHSLKYQISIVPPATDIERITATNASAGPTTSVTEIRKYECDLNDTELHVRKQFEFEGYTEVRKPEVSVVTSHGQPVFSVEGHQGGYILDVYVQNANFPLTTNTTINSSQMWGRTVLSANRNPSVAPLFALDVPPIWSLRLNIDVSDKNMILPVGSVLPVVIKMPAAQSIYVHVESTLSYGAGCYNTNIELGRCVQQTLDPVENTLQLDTKLSEEMLTLLCELPEDSTQNQQIRADIHIVYSQGVEHLPEICEDYIFQYRSFGNYSYPYRPESAIETLLQILCETFIFNPLVLYCSTVVLGVLVTSMTLHILGKDMEAFCNAEVAMVFGYFLILTYVITCQVTRQFQFGGCLLFYWPIDVTQSADFMMWILAYCTWMMFPLTILYMCTLAFRRMANLIIKRIVSLKRLELSEFDTNDNACKVLDKQELIDSYDECDTCILNPNSITEKSTEMYPIHISMDISPVKASPGLSFLYRLAHDTMYECLRLLQRLDVACIIYSSGLHLHAAITTLSPAWSTLLYVLVQITMLHVYFYRKK